MIESGVNSVASFNQAGYSQIRLHELFLRMDRLSINPMLRSEEFNCYHYEVILRDLCSILSTISSKLTESELNEALELRKELMNLIKNKPAFKTISFKNTSGRKVKNIQFNNANWENIHDKLFMLRLNLEKQMDKHGFGNPSKKDINKSVIN